MNIILILIINAILIITPILIYQYFSLYIQNMKKEKIDILLSIALFFSLFLVINYKTYIPINYQFTSLMLLVVIAFLNRKPKEGLLIGIVLSEYFVKNLNYSIGSLIILFVLMYVVNTIYMKTNKKHIYLVNTYVLLISITLLFNTRKIITKEYLDIILSIVIFSAILYIISNAITIAKDILNLHSNLKEFEKEKEIKSSLFKITHEIKNPIAVVKGYIDMFDPSDKIKSKRYINIMKSEIDRTLNLLTDFSEFSKIKVNKENIDINILIDDVKEVLIPFFKAKNVNFYFEVEDEEVIPIDYLRMKQVIINIIKNAVEACSPNIGIVSTTVFKDTESLYIYVKDNGCGMNKDVMDNILVPFYTTKEKGTGLGVSLSKEIVEAHKGNISYTSTYQKGTVCKISLPLK